MRTCFSSLQNVVDKSPVSASFFISLILFRDLCYCNNWYFCCNPITGTMSVLSLLLTNSILILVSFIFFSAGVYGLSFDKLPSKVRNTETNCFTLSKPEHSAVEHFNHKPTSSVKLRSYYI